MGPTDRFHDRPAKAGPIGMPRSRLVGSNYRQQGGSHEDIAANRGARKHSARLSYKILQKHGDLTGGAAAVNPGQTVLAQILEGWLPGQFRRCAQRSSSAKRIRMKSRR
ncbi:MAG TPA: hypothetical protein VGL42_00630 [Opitutaceae bacterium]